VGVVTIGILASIATSGGAVERAESDDSTIPLTALNEPITQYIRACPGGSFFHSPNLVEPAEVELSAAFDSGTKTDVLIPLTLSTEDSRYRVVGTLQGSTTNLAIGVIIPAEEVVGWGDCSPWMEVTIGPSASDAANGSLSWKLAIRTGMHYADSVFPWNADMRVRFEIRK